MKALPYDVAERILIQLGPNTDTIINVFMLCKATYNWYNKQTKKILCNSVLQFFQIYFDDKTYRYDHPYKLILEQKWRKKLLTSYSQLMSLYNHFYYHPYSSVSDFLIFLNENQSNESCLFELFCELCKFENKMFRHHYYVPFIIPYVGNTMVNSVCDRKTISVNDMKYLITYSNNTLLSIILRKFVLTVQFISELINEMLVNQPHVDDTKLNELITYVVYKHCFPQFSVSDNAWFQSIILQFIFHNKVSALKQIMFLKHRYHIDLNYHVLINKSIECDNLKILKIFHRSNRETLITVTPKSFRIMCETKQLNCLNYIVARMLGHTINIGGYFHPLKLAWSRPDVSKHKFDEIFKYLEENSKSNFI